MHLLKVVISIIGLSLLGGCATERYVAPTIASVPRTGIKLAQPVLASVFDGRTSGADPTAATELQSALTKIYGGNLQWGNYFDSVPEGRVALRIRIVTLGASFGSRLVSSVNYSTAVSSATISATGAWGSVVGAASGTSSIFGASISGEGWWNGAAWVDVEVEDRRAPKSIRFTVPLVAERRESNMWGYSSGDKAAREAWDSVSAQLTRTVDEIIRVLRDNEG
jgi:hypothetical protein